MFKKLVAIEPVSLIPTAEEALHQYAGQVELYRDIPADDEEIVRRIGDADAALLSYTSRMGKNVIERCPNLRYIGMCCSLYSEESANVDIAFAREKGIKVLGIRDYGDRGVVEYVLHELTGLLHGFGMPMLHDEPVEIYGLKVGIVGLGVSGRMIADALAFLGADISYYSRSHKPDAEAAGMKYKPLDALLRESEVVFTCLNKNVLLLGEPELEALGEGKVLFNTSIGPGFDSAALEKWLDKPGTHFFCDTYAAAGPVSEGFFRRPNVHSPGVSAGRTRQAFVLLSQEVLANIETALGRISCNFSDVLHAGSDHRNHCPNCLSSLHVDEEPGDRASDCGGIMEPVAVWVRKGGEWAIIHRCKRCGKLSSNRVAADDNPMKLMSIAMKPLCAPPFPLDYIEEMTALMGGDGRMR